MKKFFVFIIAFMMILMSIPVSSHDECIGEISTEPIDSGISVTALPCNHNDYEVELNDTTYHILICNVCGAEVDEGHARNKCTNTKCLLCPHAIPVLSHTTIYLNLNTTDGNEKHEVYCNRNFGSYGYCGSLGVESCIYHVNSTPVRYTGPKAGYHRKYQICGRCSTEVYTAQVRCQIDIGYIDCSYCG